MFRNALLFCPLSFTLLGACAGGEGIGDPTRPISTSEPGDPDPDCNKSYDDCLGDGGNPKYCAPKYNPNCAPDPTDGLPTTSADTDAPTSGNPTSTDTGGSATGQGMTSGVSDTDTTTGDPCLPLPCEVLQSENTPDGAIYDPVCDPQKGPTQLQYATVVSQGWLALIDTLDDCFNNQGVSSPEAFTQWLLSRHLGFNLEGWNQPADSCFLGELGSFNPTLPLWTLDLSQPLECDVGWNQTAQPTANYCFSGAATDGDHISLLQIINDTGNGVEFPKGGYLKSADLFCDPVFQYGFLTQLLIGGGLTQFDTDCHTPGGVAGKARIEVDLNGDGGDPDDPNYKFRFVVTGGPNLKVVGPTDQQVCSLN